MSRMDMNIPNTMMRNANSRRGGMRSEAAAAAVIVPGGAVVTSAMICTAQALAYRQLREFIAGESLVRRRDRLRCRRRARPDGYQPWHIPTCPRAAGFDSPPPLAPGHEPEAAARSW